MPPVDGTATRERAARLRAAGEAQVQKHLAAQIGRRHAVLMENPYMGRTEQFAEVHVSTPRVEGEIVSLVIENMRDQHLTAA